MISAYLASPIRTGDRSLESCTFFNMMKYKVNIAEMVSVRCNESIFELEAVIWAMRGESTLKYQFKNNVTRPKLFKNKLNIH